MCLPLSQGPFMPIKRLSHHKGATLVEVVLSIIILSVSLGGIYTGLMSAAKYLFEPEQILESVNIVEYYQKRIELFEPKTICHQQMRNSIDELLCSLESKQQVVIDLQDELQWVTNKKLEIHFEQFLSKPKVYQVHFNLFKDDQTLYVAQMLKVLP